MSTQPISTKIATQRSNWGDEAAKNIRAAIESIANINKEKVELQKTLMLDQLGRQRNLADKRNELEMGLEFDQRRNENMLSLPGFQDSAQPTSTASQLNPQIIEAPNELNRLPAMSMRGGGVGDVTGKSVIDTSKPMISNPDGSFSTERTITVGIDGKYYNIPTIVNGKQVDQNTAIQLFKSGQNQAVGVFDSEPEAIQAAQDRSAEIGRVRQPQLILQGVPLQPPADLVRVKGKIYKREMKDGKLVLSETEQKDIPYYEIYQKIKNGGRYSEPEAKLVLEYNGYTPQTATEKKAQMEIDENAKYEAKQLREEKSFAMDMLNTIGEIENGIVYFGAGGAVPTWVSPTDYKKVNWRANFDKLVSQRTIDTMTRMKQASKTGATGFGQLSNKELAVLENASTVLKRVMSEEDALKYLNAMKVPLRKILSNETNVSNLNQNEIDAASYIKGVLSK